MPILMFRLCAVVFVVILLGSFVFSAALLAEIAQRTAVIPHQHLRAAAPRDGGETSFFHVSSLLTPPVTPDSS